jgi:hypothetical protein
MAIRKKEIIEKQLNEAVEEAAEFYLSIDGDTSNPGFMERRDKIMTLHFELNLTYRLGTKVN